MKEFPKGGLIGKVVNACKYMGSLKISLHAAGACYFIVLGIFPALLLILGLLRYTGLGVEYLTDLLEGYLPAALMPSVEKVVVSTYRNSTGAVISVSALVALWSASRGIYGILLGLNCVYEVQEDRGWLYTRAVSVLYTFGFLIVLFLTLILGIFGDTIVRYIPVQQSFLWYLLDHLINLRFLLLLFLQTMLFTGIYMVLPNGRNGFRESLPGAVLASFGWLIFSNLFSVYVEYFPNYANIYGSIYAVALGMLWLYCCMSILFYGGVLNHYLENRRG